MDTVLSPSFSKYEDVKNAISSLEQEFGRNIKVSFVGICIGGNIAFNYASYEYTNIRTAVIISTTNIEEDNHQSTLPGPRSKTD